jgi:hypothetical protein
VNLKRSLSGEQRDKIDQIKHALDESDRALHRSMVRLDHVDRLAKQRPTENLSAQESQVLDEIRGEVLRALQRLDALDTGLLAQEDLRAALIDMAAAYAAWSSALRSRNPGEIDRLRARMHSHFSAAGKLGERGASRLGRGV